MRLARVAALFTLLIGSCSILSTRLFAQQVPDAAYRPEIREPAYSTGTGPRVGIDEAHNNFHTAANRYSPFATLLARDGYIVKGFSDRFSAATLRRVDILVIANALGEANKDEKNWQLPRESAFTSVEIEAVADWVQHGGSLLLIADHSPFAGAVNQLAHAFGIRFSDGFAYEQRDYTPPDMFVRSNGSLRSHLITDGRTPSERVESVATFSGSAFQAGASAEPLLVLGLRYVSASPGDGQSVVDESTPRISVAGWFQGAAIRFGRGRIAVFGEAAMFTAQLGGEKRSPMGMNHPKAGQNFLFLLNVLHWLSQTYHSTDTPRGR